MLSRIQCLQLCLTLLSLRVRGDKVNVDLSSYVLPMVGSEGGGNTFPGVSAPYGMVKLGPDLYNGNKDSYSGYQREGVFTGFSMLHESGTGGAPKYGVVSQLPVVGNLSNPLANHTQQRAAADEARVGYYKATLAAGLLVELGATNRAGMYRYTFPTQDNSTLNENNILVDVSHVLPSYRRKALSQRYLGGSIAVEEKQGRLQYRGSGSYDNVSVSSVSGNTHICSCGTDSKARAGTTHPSGPSTFAASSMHPGSSGLLSARMQWATR